MMDAMDLYGWMNERRIYLRMTWQQLADKAGVKRSTVYNVREEKVTPTVDTDRALERALEWTPGSLDSIRNGGEPTSVEDDIDPTSGLMPYWSAIKRSRGVAHADRWLRQAVDAYSEARKQGVTREQLERDAS